MKHRRRLRERPNAETQTAEVDVPVRIAPLSGPPNSPPLIGSPNNLFQPKGKAASELEAPLGQSSSPSTRENKETHARPAIKRDVAATKPQCRNRSRSRSSSHHSEELSPRAESSRPGFYYWQHQPTTSEHRLSKTALGSDSVVRAGR